MRPPNRFCSSLFSHVAVAKNISLESTSTGREEEERGARKEETTMMTTMTAIFGFSDRVIPRPRRDGGGAGEELQITIIPPYYGVRRLNGEA